MLVVGVATVALLALAAAIPVAAHMGPWSNTSSPSQSSGTTISLAQAKTNFEQYLQKLGYDNLSISEVMQFSNQFYAEAVDTTTGTGAFEMVMSLDGQYVSPEPGPTMMWNTTYSPMFGDQGAGLRSGMPGYGMMGGGSGYGMMSGGYGHGMMAGSDHGYDMMGGSSASASGTPTAGGTMMGYYPETATQLDQPLTAETAQARVQSWLDQNRPGVTATDATAFPGYFTFHTDVNGKITGMLSIQSSTGAIWEHVWHGDFVAMDAGTQ